MCENHMHVAVMSASSQSEFHFVEWIYGKAKNSMIMKSDS